MGNVYEALVGIYWLEGQTEALVDFLLTPMDLDQIECAYVVASPEEELHRVPAMCPCPEMLQVRFRPSGAELRLRKRRP